MSVAPFSAPLRPELERLARVLGSSRVRDGALLERDESMRAQVCVIGSGAGGATVACELARRGHSVVLLEEGAYRTGRDFTGDADAMAKLLLPGGAATRTDDAIALTIPTGRCVGGTSVLGYGTSQRLPDAVLEAWERDHGISGLGKRELAPYYERAERELGASLVPDAFVGRNASLLQHGAQVLGHAGTRVARTVSGCMATGVCDRGCPQDAQHGMHVLTVPRAVELGATLYTRARADKLLLSGSRVFGVQASLLREDGTPTGRTLRVLSDRVVVACGALATPALLLRSGITSTSGQLGRNLRVQPAVRVLGVFPGEVRAVDEVPQTYEVAQLIDDGIVVHGLPAPLATLARALPQVGRAHKAILARHARLGALAARIADAGDGNVAVRGDGTPVVHYRQGDDDRRRLLRAVSLAAELLLAAGAEEVYPALRDQPVVRDPAAAMALREADLGALDVDLVAHHPMGTARMGDDRQKSVTSVHGAVHDVQDLHVVDASLLPSATVVAPQTTIVALALRIAEHVSDSVGAPL